MLLPLVIEAVKPVVVRTRQKLTLVVVTELARTSAALALVFDATTVLARVTLPAVVLIRAIPPPPTVVPVALAVLPAMVQLTAVTEPLPLVTQIAPPEPPEEFP